MTNLWMETPESESSRRSTEKTERKEAGKGRERSSDRSDVGMRRVCGAGKAPR